MKKKYAIIIVLLLLVLAYCKNQQVVKLTMSPAEFNSFMELADHFKNPPSRYRPMAFWSLNGKLEIDEMDFQLKEFNDKGFGGVFLHPRPGLITEYLSDEWFELCKHVMEKGRELGMETWLYDENSFPSGFAGGHVQDRIPESYNQGVGLRMHKMEILPDSLERYKVILLEENEDLKTLLLRLNHWINRVYIIYLNKCKDTHHRLQADFPILTCWSMV